LDWSPTNIREAKKLEVFLHDHAKALEALHHHQHTSTFQQNTEGPSTTADQGNRTKSCSFLSRLRRLVKAARTKILEIVDGKPKIMGTNAGKMLMATLALWPAALFVLWLFMHNQIMAARELGRSTSEPDAYGLQDKILMEKIQENDRRISALTVSQLSLGARVANWEESTPISHG
jgi:acetylornithine/succinyldiaminopimelate/putrescine aminotransferase